MKSQYTLYDYLPSGNGYKVRLTAKYLNIPYRLVELDITQGATRTPTAPESKSLQ
jgi:glutathione S-transferase